ncbi:MAG: acetate--CoA ligase family protein [Chloroflexia bacterium]
MAFPEQHPFDLTTELERLIRLAERTAYGPSTQALVDEALRRDIPVLRLNDQSLVQLGHGVYQKRIRATMTSVTSSIAVDAASDKRLTNRLLSSVGIPVPRIILLDSEDDAVVAANRIGYPVVIKPLDANHGRGVEAELAHRGRHSRGLSRGSATPLRRDNGVVHHRSGLPSARRQR